jgi:protein subunit release factor B
MATGYTLDEVEPLHAARCAGRDSIAWAGQVLAMYAAWAARKGHEVLTLASVEVSGGSVYEFPRGETGLHRYSTRGEEGHQRHLARVWRA